MELVTALLGDDGGSILGKGADGGGKIGAITAMANVLYVEELLHKFALWQRLFSCSYAAVASAITDLSQPAA
eukprot:5864139-Pleurochrysis_carterae.AAC.2